MANYSFNNTFNCYPFHVAYQPDFFPTFHYLFNNPTPLHLISVFLHLSVWKGFGCTLKRIRMELSEESSGQEQENLRFSDNTILPFVNPEPYTDD